MLSGTGSPIDQEIFEQFKPNFSTRVARLSQIVELAELLGDRFTEENVKKELPLEEREVFGIMLMSIPFIFVLASIYAGMKGWMLVGCCAVAALLLFFFSKRQRAYSRAYREKHQNYYRKVVTLGKNWKTYWRAWRDAGLKESSISAYGGFDYYPTASTFRVLDEKANA